MLRVFFFLVSLTTDYGAVSDLAHYVFTLGVVSASVLGVIAVRLGFRSRLAKR